MDSKGRLCYDTTRGRIPFFVAGFFPGRIRQTGIAPRAVPERTEDTVPVSGKAYFRLARRSFAAKTDPERNNAGSRADGVTGIAHAPDDKILKKTNGRRKGCGES